MDSLLRLHEADPVAIATTDLPDGIPAGHKVATRAIAKGEEVRKYGQIIGFATRAIEPGEHVHVHNIEFRTFERDYAFCADATPTEYVPEAERATFQGYRRENGKVGTRNYIGVLTSVNCSATAARRIADTFNMSGALEDVPDVDGIVALTHGTGCGMAADGEGIEVLRRTLAGYAAHPNFGGFLVVGLGCEVNQIAQLTEGFEIAPGVTMSAMTIQELGGTKATVREGVARVKEMLPDVGRAQRESVPVSELILGVECGGSDGWSGITANPALGAAADLLVRQGGTALLGETPEIYGAEHLLTRRAVSEEVGRKLVERIKWWERYTEKNGGSMDNNPSPGNKDGGLTTILEKSLGAAVKGGTTNLVDVYEYAEQVTERGFVFMDTPGFDPVSVTGKVAGGANVVCFTTGRGSVYGCKPTPSLKLATNTAMYSRMAEDMDINCGEVLDSGVGVEEMGKRIFDLVVETASGKPSKSEELGFGDEEFTPWQLGATM